MSQYILLNNITVQNANAIAGFTWGFPAITHFLGFTHNLSRKLIESEFDDIALSGCAVISHKTHVHTYGKFEKQFTQSRNPAYCHKEKTEYKVGTPPVIEEGKMNMTVSLLISYDGYIGQNKQDSFKDWLMKMCFLQRLAGGSILEIEAIGFYRFDSSEKEAITKLRVLKRKLLPGFLLKEQSGYLEDNFQELSAKDENIELLDAWLDFITLKQKARPKSNLITQHIKKLDDNEKIDLWMEHLKQPYQEDVIPELIMLYFANLSESQNTKLLAQWSDYCTPTEKTDADWEYVPKPKKGFLVPIMTGYKAISKTYDLNEIENIRAQSTDDAEKICFVESVHSIGEWLSVHRIKDIEALSQCIWKYKPYEENWYLCTQTLNQQETNNIEDDCSIH
jgi:CRISPR-associated protein Csy2